MTEDQSFQLPPGENNLLGATSNNGIACGRYDFNKYDPYVDRIRTLFVPSLESRIHSCLETFVYRQESGQRSDPPYLKRCLDAAATLRDPVEAFCTKWRDSETSLVETMLASVVKFVISNGPIDCFLNSIVLNNRLNKVCRDLDSLGVEKDLLRYLAVWNYINERDYWLEEDKIISTSKSDESRDSVDHPSDLAVEVGSGLDSQRNDRSIRRAFKRRATDDSSDDKNQSSRASQNFPENPRSRVPFPSRLSIDSSNPEGSRSSSARKKIRTSQARPCRPATCPTYRAKKPAPVNWEGKTLKLQLCKTSASSLDRRECRRSSEQSELDLPCKFDDLVAEIFKAHPTSSRRFKFKAGATSVCSRLNETLGRLDRKAVGRCRLHCEILPGCLGFRLIERDRDGSEVCLFSDRVPIDRIDAPQRSPRRSSGSEPRRIGDRQNADEAERCTSTMYKNSGFSPADEESRVVGSRAEEAAIETQPEDVLVRPSDVDLEAVDRKYVQQSIEQGRNEASNRSSEDKVGEAACGCNTPFDDEARQREEDDEDEGSEPKNHPRDRSLNRSNGNAIADDRGDCDGKLDGTAGNEESNEAADRDNVEDLAGGESAIRSNGNLTEDQKCTCSVSFDCTVDLLDRAIEADRQSSGIADSHQEIAEAALEDAAEMRRAKLRRTSSGSFFLKKCQPDVPTDNRLDEIACVCSSDCTCPNGSAEEHQVKECDSKCSCDSCGREDEPRLLKKTEIVRMSSLLKRRTETLDSAAQELPVTNSTQRNGALVSASDELQRGCGNENQDAECESKCSCDSCGREDEPRLLKETEIVRMSSLLKRRIENLDSGLQDSPDQNSSQRNEALASGSDEFQCGCAKAQSSGFRSQDLEFRQGTSMKSDTWLETNATKTMSFIEADSQRAQPDRGSAVQQASSAKNERPGNLSSEEHPVVSTRLSLNNATETMSFIEAASQRVQRSQPDCSSAVQQASSATRNLSSEEHQVVSARLFLNNATKTMSFIEADSQRVQPDRGSAVQQASSATNKRPRNLSSEEHPVVSTRLSLKKNQSHVPTDNQLDKAACACPSDCTCPNRSTEETQPAECDSQCSCDTCHQEDESRPLKKTETIRMSSLLRRHTETLRSAVQDSADPTSTLKNGASMVSAGDEFQRDTCHQEDESRPLKKTGIIRMSSLLKRHTETLGSAVQDSADPTSTLKNGAFLVSARDEFQRGCTEAQTSSNSSFHTQDLELHEGPSMKSDSPLDPNAPKTMSFIKSESPPAQPDRDSAVQRPTSSTRLRLFAEQPQPRDTNKSRRNASSEERPIVASRLSRPKGQRINISIEVCPGSESSSERTRRNDRESTNDELKVRKDATSLRKSRRHSVEPKPFERHVLPHPGEDTGDEFLGLSGSTDTGVRSPRPLEFREYLQPFRPPSSMRNPIVYGTSRTSGRRSIGMDGRSAGQGGRRRGDSCVTENRHGSIGRKYRANDQEEMPEEMPKPDAFSASGLRKNVGQALSASSVDRMKHLIRTKLRRMLLERDKATNTPKTTLTNKKYRVSVPGGKTDRSLVGRQPCRTIWESRSASDSVRTSRSFASDDCTKLAAISEREKARKLFRSTGNPSVSTSRSRHCGGAYRRFDGVNSSPNSESEWRRVRNERAPEVDSVTDFPRLAGGSDFGSMRKRHENVHWSGKRENQCARQNKNGGFDEKFMNHSRKEVPSAGNSCDASDKKISDECAEFHGILRNERAPEVDSETDFPRLAGGSDLGSKRKRHENMHWSGKRENQCVRQNKKGGFDEKFMNRSRKEVPEVIGDSSGGNSCDASSKKISDAESAEFHGILRVAGSDRAPEVDSETDFPRFAGGSDFGSKTKRHEKTHSSGKRENRCASQTKNARIDRFDEKSTNHSFKELPEEIGVSSAGNSRDASGKKVLDESSEFHGKLDWSGNSTSRHICLFEFDRLVSSNDETESAGCCRSPRKTRLPEVRRTPRRNVDPHPKKLIVSRARDKSAMSDCSSNTNNVCVSGVRRIGVFGNIDQDLRKKLSQYVSLCKNVKYSLLKRLRPDDIYEVSRTSIPCCDRYKFGDT